MALRDLAQLEVGDGFTGNAASPPLDETGLQTRKRSKFTADERERVRQVRNKGACLRCKMLKMKCSPEDPCKPCLESAAKGKERKALSFCYCIRNRFIDVDIFRHEIPVRDHFPLRARLMAVQKGRGGAPGRDQKPDVETMAAQCMDWILDIDNRAKKESIVGLLTGEPFSVALQGLIDDDVVENLQAFIFSVSLTYVGWRDWRSENRLTTRDLHRISHLAGSALLQRLDRILSPLNLGKASSRALQAAFLVVFGTILGVAYSTQVVGSPEFPQDLLSAEFRQSPTLWVAMKEHLCQMLAHHLILIASWLGYKLDTAKEQVVVEMATRRWNLPETFVWANPLTTPPAPGAPVSNRAVEMMNPAPQTVPCPPELLRPDLPAFDEPRVKRRRTVIAVGPWAAAGGQVYARFRASPGEPLPRLFA